MKRVKVKFLCKEKTMSDDMHKSLTSLLNAIDGNIKSIEIDARSQEIKIKYNDKSTDCISYGTVIEYKQDRLISVAVERGYKTMSDLIDRIF